MRKTDPNKLATLNVLDEYMREHVAENVTAARLWEDCSDRIPAAFYKRIQAQAGQRAVSDMLRQQKDSEGVRIYGSYHSLDGWAWKPLDIMTAAQLRETFSHVLSQMAADARSMVRLESKLNGLLQRRNAVPLDPSWRDLITAIFDGEDEDSEEMESSEYHTA